MKKTLVLLAIITLLTLPLAGCAQVDKVSNNLSLEADNFNIVRKLTVINSIQGDVLFQMIAKMSIKADVTDNQLEVVVEDENGNYAKHFIGLSDNVSYIVEDMGSKSVNKYRYELNFNPKMWIPVQPVIID